MPWLLELAMGLSFALKHDFEGIIIFVLLTVNAIIGHIHSRGSQKAVELLKKKLAVRAKVLRDGVWRWSQEFYQMLNSALPVSQDLQDGFAISIFFLGNESSSMMLIIQNLLD